MKPFELARPTTTAEAVTMLGQPAGKALPLAGGQDLLALMKDYVLQPERLVSLRDVSGLNRIEVTRDGSLSLGALVTLAQIAESKLVAGGWPILVAAAGEAATPQIRNLGTVGGNLCQKPRCWYYRAEELHCLRKGGETCLAAAGDHRYHSIYTTSACIAPNMSALGNVGTALGASVTVVGPRGQRNLSLTELYAPLLADPTRDTALAPDELITHLVIPPAAGWAMAHEEVRFKQSYDWPLAMASAVLRLRDGVVQDGRLVLGAVGPVPISAEPAVAVLKGKRLTAELAAEAAEAALRSATPPEQLGYKVPLTRHLVGRVLRRVAGLGED